MALNFVDGSFSAGGVPLEVLEQKLTSWASNIAAAEARWLGWLGEYDARRGWEEWGCSSAAHWLSWKCGMSPGVAREKVRVAAALRELPAVAATFGEGRLSYSKVRAVTRVANPFNEADLVHMALEGSGAQLERICRGYRDSKPVDAQAALSLRQYSTRRHHDGTTTITIRAGDADAALIDRAVKAETQAIIDNSIATSDIDGWTRRKAIEDRGGIDAVRCDAITGLVTGTAHTDGTSPADITLTINHDDHRHHIPAGTSDAASAVDVEDVPAGTPDAVAAKGVNVSAGTPDTADTPQIGNVSAGTPDTADTPQIGDVSAGTPDAPTAADAGDVSAGTPDAPTAADAGAETGDVSAGTPEASAANGPNVSTGTPDAPTAADAGDVSARTPDAPTAADAGDVSAGTPDAPTAADAGDVPAGTPDLATMAAIAAETPGVLDRYQVTVEGLGVSRPEGERLCCDPRISVLIEDAKYKPLGAGRQTRLINRRLRRALERRDHNACRFPGCASSRGLHAHHIIHWINGGLTELDNLILVCHFHHHLVHEGGWNINPATFEFIKPDRTPVDPRPDTARSRGNADALPPTAPPLDQTPFTPGLLEPGDYGPFDLAWTTTIIHHNEDLRTRNYDAGCTRWQDAPAIHNHTCCTNRHLE